MEWKQKVTEMLADDGFGQSCFWLETEEVFQDAGLLSGAIFGNRHLPV